MLLLPVEEPVAGLGSAIKALITGRPFCQPAVMVADLPKKLRSCWPCLDRQILLDLQEVSAFFFVAGVPNPTGCKRGCKIYSLMEISLVS